MRVTTSRAEIMDAAMEAADPEVSLVAQNVLDSARRREQARASRESAREDRIALLRGTAAKLREMANWALGSRLLQMTQYLNDKTGAVDKAAGALLGDSLGKAIGQGAAMAAKLDPFEIAKNYCQVHKQQLETQAEVASHRVTDAADTLAEAERRQSFLLNLSEKLGEALHSARMAALRG